MDFTPAFMSSLAAGRRKKERRRRRRNLPGMVGIESVEELAQSNKQLDGEGLSFCEWPHFV